MPHAIPGYLHTTEARGAFMGGIMVTDHHGIPLDFKYTDPIQPTELQRIIYGAVLQPYIQHHVLIAALAKEGGVPPSFYVVSDSHLTQAQEGSGLPLIALERTQFAPLREKGSTSRASEGECLVQGFHNPHPFRVFFGTMPRGRQEEILGDLIRLSKTMDLAEPLERLKTALLTLCQQGVAP